MYTIVFQNMFDWRFQRSMCSDLVLLCRALSQPNCVGYHDYTIIARFKINTKY